MNQIEDELFCRADEHIELANKHGKTVEASKVSASFLYGAARFNAFIAACNAVSGDDLQSGKSEIMSYYVEQYKKMLEDNLTDYIANFDSYMGQRD